MSDLETLLRSTLAEHAAAVDPRPDAIRATVAAVRRRRRIRSTAQALAGAAAVAAIVVAATLWHPVNTATAPSPQPAATATTTAEASTTTADSNTEATTPLAPSTSSTTATTANLSTVAVQRVGIINAIFGADWTGQPHSSSGFGGDIFLTPGSPSAAGLPAGYSAAASSVALGPTSQTATGPAATMTAFCAPLAEKGATTKACVPQEINGLTVQRSETDAPNIKIGTFANLRILYQRPDQLVAYTEVSIWNTAHATTAQERAIAKTWLNAQTTKLATAATTGP